MIKIIKGDITNYEGDAIVNAANSGLYEGGGVCGAIFQAAGNFELAKECYEAGNNCPCGKAVITSGCKLKVKYIIHAVGPRYGLDKDPEEKLEEVYNNIFKLAKEKGIKNIAVPSISTGIFGFPLDKAVVIAYGVAKKYENVFDEIVLYCYDMKTYETYKNKESEDFKRKNIGINDFEVKELYHKLSRSKKINMPLHTFEEIVQGLDLTILYKHNVERKSLRDLGKELHMSHENIRLIENKMLDDITYKYLMESGWLATLNDDTKITKCRLPIRTENALVNAGVDTIGQLKNLTDEDLLSIKGIYNFGLHAINNLVAYISQYDIVKSYLQAICNKFEINPLQIMRIALLFEEESEKQNKQ